QIRTIKGVSVADVLKISCIVDLDEQALAVGGARGERECLFVFLFSLDRRICDEAEIVIAERCVGHGKVWVALDRSAHQSYGILEFPLMPECGAICVLLESGQRTGGHFR